MEAFIDHRNNGSALSVEDHKTVVKGQIILRKLNAGWDICYEWKDGSTLWEKLSNFKELYPIQVVKYAIAQCIQHEPALNWWVHHVLKERDRIISNVNWHSAYTLIETINFGSSCQR